MERAPMLQSVAQVSNLLYRRLPAGLRDGFRANETGTLENEKPSEFSTVCGLEIRDTAGWKPALRGGKGEACLRPREFCFASACYR